MSRFAPAAELLAALQAKWPAYGCRNHGMMMAPDGRILVCLALDAFYSFTLDDGDMDRDTAAIVADIEPLLMAEIAKTKTTEDKMKQPIRSEFDVH